MGLSCSHSYIGMSTCTLNLFMYACDGEFFCHGPLQIMCCQSKNVCILNALFWCASTHIVLTLYRSLLLAWSSFNQPSTINKCVLERCGFITITVVQLAASFVIYVALHHETQFKLEANSSQFHCHSCLM